MENMADVREQIIDKSMLRHFATLFIYDRLDNLFGAFAKTKFVTSKESLSVVTRAIEYTDFGETMIVYEAFVLRYQDMVYARTNNGYMTRTPEDALADLLVVTSMLVGVAIPREILGRFPLAELPVEGENCGS